MLQAGVTDGRFFARLGIQTYGFLPLRPSRRLRDHAAHPRRRRARAGGRAPVRRRRDRAGDRAVPGMKLLVLGGTKFLGRHAVAHALADGHEVTIVQRAARRTPSSFPRSSTCSGDRDGDLDALRGRAWDGVVDPSGYVPRIVRQSRRAAARRRRAVRLRLDDLGLRRLQRTGQRVVAGRRARGSGDRGDPPELRRPEGGLRAGRRGGVRRPQRARARRADRRAVRPDRPVHVLAAAHRRRRRGARAGRSGSADAVRRRARPRRVARASSRCTGPAARSTRPARRSR